MITLWQAFIFAVAIGAGAGIGWCGVKALNELMSILWFVLTKVRR